MAVLKKISRSQTFQNAATWLLAAYLRFVHRSGRWEIVNREHLNAASAMAGGAMVFAFWHGRLTMMWGAPGERARVHALISAHSDGRMIARIIERLGMNVVTGSSSRGGAKAMLQMIRILRKGDMIGVTPDGPRGPRMRAQVGTIALAQAANVPVLPMSFSAKRCRFLQSWDRMQLVHPFTRGLYIYGEPFLVPRNAEDLEPYRQRLEDSLNSLTVEADLRMGHTPIQAADPNETKGAKS